MTNGLMNKLPPTTTLTTTDLDNKQKHNNNLTNLVLKTTTNETITINSLRTQSKLMPTSSTKFQNGISNQKYKVGFIN